MKIEPKRKLALIAAMLLVSLAGLAETREESIVRENSYLAAHPVEQVAHYWDAVKFADTPDGPLTMDISAPEGDGPFPVLMIIHGGGWEIHTNTIMEGMARYITNRGYVVFNINYRVRPEVGMQTIVEDCIGAFLWIKEHAAEYKGDPLRFAVTGDSAGGHLTAMLVTSRMNPAFKPTYQPTAPADTSITCAVPSYGVFDLRTIGRAGGLGERFVGAAPKDDPALYELISPITHVAPGLPPQLCIVGDLDPLFWESVSYVKALKKAGNPAELWIHHGQPHAFLNEYWNKNGTKGFDRILQFLDKHMK